jgi:hypothetical protein
MGLRGEVVQVHAVLLEGSERLVVLGLYGRCNIK